MRNTGNINSYEVQEILNELSECREDERTGKNQIFAILAAVATFIAVIVTLLSIADGGATNILSVNRKSLALGANMFSTFLLGAAVPWIANVGFISSFRHFYIIELETKLSQILDDESRGFYHWESISTPVITFNLKHILPGYSMFYSLNMYISFISILALAVAYILFVQLFLDTFNIINIIMIVWFWILFVIVLFTIVAASLKSEEIYKQAKDCVKNRNIPKQGTARNGIVEITNFIFYFLYPRIADIPKNAFLLIGLFVGVVFGNGELFDILSVDEWKIVLYRLVYVWFILDFLVYQARYLWNDLRGIDSDNIHPVKGKRKRLPVTLFGEKAAILLSISVIVFRLIAAFVLIILYGGALRPVLISSIFFLLIVSVLYEHAKLLNSYKWIFGLVFFGYPLRLFCGIVSANPFFLRQVVNKPLELWVLCCVLFATAAFGETFVILTWTLDAVFLEQNGITTEKEHYRILREQVSDSHRKEQYPLAFKSSIKTIWNKMFFCSIFFLTLSTASISLSNISEVEVLIMPICAGIGTVFIVNSYGWKMGKERNLGIFLLILMAVVECLRQYKYGIEERIVLYIAMVLLRVGYSLIFLMFKQMNYEELMSFGDKFKKKFVQTVLLCIKVLLGEAAYEKLNN